MTAAWRFWIDTGGTFTDCTGRDPEGRTIRVKLLSEGGLRGVATGPRGAELEVAGPAPDGLLRGYRVRRLDGAGEARPGDRGPSSWRVARSIAMPPTPGRRTAAEASRRTRVRLELEPDPDTDGVETLAAGDLVEVLSPEPAPLFAMRLATGRRLDEELPSCALRLATTRGTNALLERKGVETALFTDPGLVDLLRIGDQARPELFALEPRRPEPLHRGAYGVPGRLSARGETLTPVDLEAVEREAKRALESGHRAAAVALLHSYRDPTGERRVAARLRELGFEYVAESAELSPTIKLLGRAATAVVDAYLGPVLREYLDGVTTRLPRGAGCLVMTSIGGLASSEHFRAKDSLLSGPAAGVVGAAREAEAAGFERSLTFDMGGTSTDVARYDGELAYHYEQRVGDAVLGAPTLAIHTVAAGGGSICHQVDGWLRVGPESAGARPGPACYGAGGPLTLTDVNLLRGRLVPERFGIPLEPGAAAARAEELRREIGGLELQEMLEGLSQIANERMAEAVRRISIRQGYDCRDYVLVSFGGAGGQHACALAELLEIDTVLVPQDASLLSAVGLGAAHVERLAERQVLRPLDAATDLDTVVEGLAEELRGRLDAEGLGDGDAEIARRLAFVRLAGQESSLEVPFARGEDIRPAFEARYRELYGELPQRVVELEAIRVVVRAPSPSEKRPDGDRTGSRAEKGDRGNGRAAPEAPAAGGFAQVPREDLGPDRQVVGPCLITEAHSVTVVEEGWRAAVHRARGCLVLRRDLAPRGGERRPQESPSVSTSSSPSA